MLQLLTKYNKDIKELDLSNQNISKIEGLDEYTKLEVLNLSGNNIKVLEGISYLTNLRVLILDDNKISNIDTLCISYWPRAVFRKL